MKVHSIYREQLLPVGIEEAWKFFSSAGNLSKITPPEMRFVILTHLEDKAIYSGMKIHYIIRPFFGIPMKWTTVITQVDEPYVFTDKQAKGPYTLWEHTHTFSEVPGGVCMKDEVRYALPLGLIGNLVHRILVRKKLKQIFDFRANTLIQLFGKHK